MDTPWWQWPSCAMAALLPFSPSWALPHAPAVWPMWPMWPAGQVGRELCSGSLRGGAGRRSWVLTWGDPPSPRRALALFSLQKLAPSRGLLLERPGQPSPAVLGERKSVCTLPCGQRPLRLVGFHHLTWCLLKDHFPPQCQNQ